MKKLTILFAFLITFLSCSSDNQSPLQNYLGKWELTQMTGTVPNSETTGSKMEWQEYYLIKPNGKFIKSRNRNGIITEISGTYKIVNSSTENLLMFKYSNESQIIGSCTSKLNETLYFNSQNILFNSWNACDGPSLKYEKSK